MVEKIDGSKKVRIKDAGHIMNMDKQEEFNRVVTDFIHSIN